MHFCNVGTMDLIKKFTNGLSRILQIYLMLQTIGSTQCLRLTNMSTPRIADLREDMHLDCHYDMGAEILYAVKWYKDDNEFFRYTPNHQPQTLSFPVAGVHIKSNERRCDEYQCKLKLTNLTRDHSGGAYRCEVSSDAPAFRLASETHNVTIAALQREEPHMTGLADSYSLGELLVVECRSAPANPTPVISWYINNQPVSPILLGDAISSTPNSEGLAWRSVALKIPIERRYLQGSVIHLRCEASLPSIPVQPKSISHTVIVKTSSTQVNNQKLHWPNSSGPQREESKLFLILVLLLGNLRWREDV